MGLQSLVAGMMTVGALLAGQAPATAQSALLVRPDAPAVIDVDGRQVVPTPVPAWGIAEIAVPPGEHLVSVLSLDRLDRWEQVVTVGDGSKVYVLAALAEVTRAREAARDSTAAVSMQREQLARLEQQLLELRGRRSSEMAEVRAATRAAENARSAPAPFRWNEGLNKLAEQVAQNAAQKHQAAVDQLDEEIAELERRIQQRMTERF